MSRLLGLIIFILVLVVIAQAVTIRNQEYALDLAELRALEWRAEACNFKYGANCLANSLISVLSLMGGENDILDDPELIDAILQNGWENTK